MIAEEKNIAPSVDICGCMDLVDRYLTRLIGEGLKPKTQKEYSNVFKRLLKVYPDPYAMTEEDVLTFRDSLAVKANGKPIETSTMRLYVAAINSIMEFLRKSIRLKPPRVLQKIVKPLTDNELKALIQAAGKNASTFHARRDTAIILVMVEAAQRRAGAANIRLEDFDPLRGVVIIRGYKKDNDRSIPIPPFAVEAVSRYIEVRGVGKTAEDEQYLFLTRDGGHISEKTAADIVKRCAGKASIPRRVHSHLLKHTKLTQLGNAGMSPFLLQGFSGHKNIQNLAKYVHPLEEDVRKAVLANPMITSDESAPRERGPSADETERKLVVLLSEGKIDPETFKIAFKQLEGGARGMGA